ncbi:MAG: chromosome segregation protein SMC, partial [Planctomycetes bacterium]|nr:chromosome segregation protein SMC [Planctomycetota bacterium]
MFLKRIVLRGFKSFADRTEFDFGSGLTCIVGPNGCGKSNVLDALRWVLGEQKPRTLRGAKMADVIFVGSRSRKPASLAQVELTFDNRASFLASDESEVVISRVLYAGGQSEYRLNGNLCRLKDVRNLFLDTGVGVDAYSIIEQGRVDVLLASSPLERREIFEEAAGISRYKVRRTEAQRKLERTQNNLLRLSDVIEELEKRLRSVKLAAGKARSFQQYDARLRELRSSFSLAEYHDLEQARLTAYARAEERGAELQTHRTELARSDADAAQLEHEVQDLDEQIQAVEAGLLTRQTEQSALGERIAQTQRRLTELGAIRTRRRSQATDLADSVAALRERIAAEDATLGELIEAVERSSEQITQLEQARTAAELASAENRQALEREKAAAFEAARRCALLHNEQQNLVQQQQRLASQADGLTQRQQQLETEQERLARQHGQLTERGEELEREVNDLSSALRQTEARLAELATEGNELDKRIGAEKEARSATLSRLELLEDMDRRHEGVDQGTRSVLAWGESGECTGSVLGLVADVFQIDDPRLSILQTVLGTFENHLIVRDTYAFLAELKQRAELAGPVRVLALDRVPQEQPRTSYHDAPGFVARAADWVRCSAEFRPLADSLLGRTIVVDCVERALACAAGAPQGYTFVTLAGDTVDTHGRMTIGATKATAGLISRKAEIRQLRGELDEIETRLERTVRQRAELERAASDVQMQRGALVDQIAAAQREHADQRAALTRVDDARQRVRREAALVGSETAAAQRALA